MKREKTLSPAVLQEFIRSILTSLGVPAAKADLVAESLVAANLRGVDSHGVQLIPAYAAQLRAGNIDPNADGRILTETGACMLFDGQHGIGQCISDACCGHAVRLAQGNGVALVIARDSNHFGAAAFWAQRIASAGMIGIVMCNASPSVAPWQGRDGRVGTNPICMAVPSSGKGAWLLDMATTTVAKNKIVRAAASGDPSIPSGWAMDKDGEPTTDPQAALRGLLMPLGGYKGSGLGLMVEILCGVLGGGPLTSDVGGLYHLDRRMGTGQLFLAIDVSRFAPPEDFQSRMEYVVRGVKSSRPAAGFDEVLVAGEPESRSEALRRREGIPIDAGSWSRLCALARELGVMEPAPDTRDSDADFQGPAPAEPQP